MGPVPPLIPAQRPASAQLGPCGQAALSHTASEGVDMLWKFQLRKENAALLEQLEASEKVLEAQAADTSRVVQNICEKMNELDAKMAKMENEVKKDRQEQENYTKEIRSLKQTLETFKEKSSTESNIFQGRLTAIETATPVLRPKLAPCSTTNPSASRQRQAPITKEAPLPIERSASQATTASTSSLSDTSSTPPARIVAAQAKLFNTSHAKRSKNPSPKLVTKATPAIKRTSAFRSAPAIKSTSTLKGMPTGRGMPVPRGKPVVTNKPEVKNEIPLLSQQPAKRLVQASHTSLRTYHDKYNTSFLKLANKDKAIEYEYVACFIKGLRDSKQRSNLVKELLKTNASRAGQDGKMEILCDWEDVGNSLRNIGLLPPASDDDEDDLNPGHLRKRKRMV